MRSRGACVRVTPRPLHVTDLMRSLPGGQRSQHSMQATSKSQVALCHVISYIEFLQRRIRDTQDTLVPYSSLLGFRPLWTPQLSLDNTKKAEKCPPNTQKRCQPKTCVESLLPDSEPGMGQKLVSYLSSSSSENGDTGPWLVSVAVSPHPTLSPCTPRSLAPTFLGLSPSLQSSPADDVTVGGLVPPVLFEEVQICCGSPVQESTEASTLSLDHSYQLQKGISTGSSGPRQDGSLKENRRVDRSVGSELKTRPPSSVTKPKAQGVKVKPAASGHRPSAQTSGKAGKPPDPSMPQPIKKKCVNGFIMFCRLNRKAYLRANPGTASTAATRDLAELWRKMSLQERRPYCMKALQFSLIHDRLVKQRNVTTPPSDTSSPKPLSVLLLEKSFPAVIL